jgi:hypothetical protein
MELLIHSLSKGKLALKLAERKPSFRFKSRIIRVVYDTISWVSEPLQSIADAFLLGYKAGQQSGDCVYAFNNLLLAIYTNYFAGQHLDVVRKNISEAIPKLKSHGVKIFDKSTSLLLSHIMGLQDETPPVDDEGPLAGVGSGSAFSLHGKMLHLTKTFLFHQIHDAQLNVDISGAVAENHHQLNPYYLMGYFVEGLASFQLARKPSSNNPAKRIERGQSVLAKMRRWSEHSTWNWKNKMLLLDAESMRTMGEIDKAGPLYDDAIRSAREHKFIHEEAIASELAGTFYYERGLHQKSYSCFVHSLNCYKKWGAHAVARRVETDIQDYFGNDFHHLK